jgi:hypothetical protein
VIPLALETGADGFGDRVLVFDDEHGLRCHAAIVSTATCAEWRPGMEKS